MQTIYIDISNKSVVPTIYTKQGDVGRKFEVVFTNSGLPYVPPNGSVFSVWYSGSSGEGNYTDIGDRSAFSVNENRVAVEMIAQMLTNDGTGILCLVLNEPNGNQIGSWNIPYLCEKVPGFESEGAKEYYTAFSESVEKLKQVTENLTPEAIGAAPAGYGLGGVSQRVDSADDATQSGFYQAPVFPETGGGGQMFGYVSKSEDDWLTQIWHYVGLTIKRDKQGGVWKPLEWFNPPMVLGVLYRTTKRCEGKPVYAIRVDCGALPNDTVTNTPLNMSVAEYGADVKLVGIDYTVKHPDTAKPHHIGNPSYIDGVPMNCRLYSNGALYYCRFQTHGDLSAYTAVATLELILGG